MKQEKTEHSQNIRARIDSLRIEMKKENLDVWLVPSSDSHMSEYVAEHWKTREWLSGFTGSAGTLVVTLNNALLWTDGRYFVQAAIELEGTGISLMKAAIPGVPTILQWLFENLQAENTVGANAALYSVKMWKEYEDKLVEKNIILKSTSDITERIWKDRPTIPSTPVFVHEACYAGLTPTEKLEQIRQKMCEKNIDQYLLSALDSIAWLYNIRGNDVAHNPVSITYARVGKKDAEIYINKSKLDEAVLSHFQEHGILVSTYEDITEALTLLPDQSYVAYDPALTNAAIVDSIPKGCKKIEISDYVVQAKAVKNDVEIENLKKSQSRDGAAMVRFLIWLEQNVNDKGITEMDAVQKLSDLRSQLPLNYGDSFDAIAAYGANAAMMHYKATENNQSVIEAKGLLLVDSGGQYLDGTTDITRTIAVGPITNEECIACTLTLKSHIALATAQFLEGSTGSNLDILARLPMWKAGMDYKCGTGHGVGYFLSVHEGPHGIRQTHNPYPLVPGMIVTNEPGVYRAESFGVRTENTLLVVSAVTTEDGNFYRFETISCCPIDKSTIDFSMLTRDEKEWLNEYHAFVLEKVAPHLNPNELAWLEKAVEPVLL